MSQQHAVVGLYKLCEHKGRARDHGWWARFRRVRVSLEKWANREIKTKTEAETVFDDLQNAVRNGTFDRRGVEAPRETTALTLRQFAELYKERHVFANPCLPAKSLNRLQVPIEMAVPNPAANRVAAEAQLASALLFAPRSR